MRTVAETETGAPFETHSVKRGGREHVLRLQFDPLLLPQSGPADGVHGDQTGRNSVLSLDSGAGNEMGFGGESVLREEFVAGADGGDNVAALAAKVCLEQVDAYYTSPAFPGSSEARSRVGELMAGCMTDAAALGDLTKPENDAKLDELIQKRFDEAITKCEQSIAGFGI